MRNLVRFLAKEVYGIKDEEILSAIEWHTTGKPEMSLLDKIVFIADYIEPNRDQAPHLDKIRQMAFTDLDQWPAYDPEADAGVSGKQRWRR